MAGSIDPSDYDETCTYGGQKKLREALARLLVGKDPKDAKKRKANGSNARGQLGVLRETPTLLILQEALRRERQVVTRQQTAARVANHRQRHGRRDRQ